MFKATIDRPKLEKSLKRFAKDFGETSAQAVVRWSVHACRELAFETQAWGKGKNKDGLTPKQSQEGAIIEDSYNVLLVVDELLKTRRGYKATNRGKSYYVSESDALVDAGSVNDWIEMNRTRRLGRTAKLPPQERKVCDRKTHKAAMRIRFKMAGAAKGGWLGAGQDIAKAQIGQDRINIGKNFMSYAQKHSHFGSATKPQNGWKPVAGLTNRVSYSGSGNVLAANAPRKAFEWSLKKTVKWYASALRRQNQKQKV